MPVIPDALTLLVSIAQDPHTPVARRLISPTGRTIGEGLFLHTKCAVEISGAVFATNYMFGTIVIYHGPDAKAQVPDNTYCYWCHTPL